jgi:hypothetical protein
MGRERNKNQRVNTSKDKKLLFTPRHDFFSLDAGALIKPCGFGAHVVGVVEFAFHGDAELVAAVPGKPESFAVVGD